LIEYTVIAVFRIINNNTHLMAFFPEQPGYAGTRKVKPFWILMKQEIMG